MKTKIGVVVLIAVSAGVFAYTRPHNTMPSDLRDAVADSAVGTLKEQTGERDIKIPEPKPAPAKDLSKAAGNKAGAASQGAILLNIRVKDGIRLSAKAVYMATNGSPSCTHTSFSDGSLQHLPNVIEKPVPVEASGETARLKAEVTLADSCRSKMKGLTLQAAHPKIPEQFGRIEVVRTDAGQGTAVQKVVFRKFESPYIGTFYSIGEQMILTGSDGVANVEIALQKENSPLTPAASADKSNSYIPNGREVQIQDVLGCDHPAENKNADDMGDIVYLDGSETLSAHIGAYSVRTYRDNLAEQDKVSVIRLCEVFKNLASGIPGQGQKVLLITKTFTINDFTRRYVKGLVVPATGEVIMINRAMPID